MNTLKSMTAYVLEQSESLKNAPEAFDKYLNIVNYAKFLSMPLELKMFVPTGENGNVLEEPEHYDLWKRFGSFTQYGEHLTSVCEPYFRAQSEVLFEGFEKCIGGGAVSNNEYCTILIHDNGKYSASGKQVIKIEDLVKYNLTLTTQAKEKFNF